MNPKFDKKFISLEKKKNKIVETISGLDREILNKKLKEDKWSITQILFHIVKTERLVEISIKNKIKDKNLKEIEIHSSFMILYCRFAFASFFKFKAPDLLRNIPEVYDIEELKSKWQIIRKEFKELLEEFPPDFFNSSVFEHPYFGKFNIFQTLDFLYYHIKRHEGQITRIIKSSNKIDGEI
jgi:DinB superfamily